jgi:hypothetical protein
LTISEDSFDCPDLDEERAGAPGLWVEAKEAAKHSALHRTVTQLQRSSVTTKTMATCREGSICFKLQEVSGYQCSGSVMLSEPALRAFTVAAEHLKNPGRRKVEMMRQRESLLKPSIDGT